MSSTETCQHEESNHAQAGIANSRRSRSRRWVVLLLLFQAKSYYLAELALDFARQHLKPDGAFLIKVFQGAGFEAYVKAMRAVFGSVAVRKPGASRDRSSEVYLLGRGLRGPDVD